MGSMRYAEYALMLVPVGLAIAWMFGVRGLSRRGTIAACLLLAGMGGALYWMGNSRSFTGRYTPARLQGQTVVPGHAG